MDGLGLSFLSSDVEGFKAVGTSPSDIRAFDHLICASQCSGINE